MILLLAAACRPADAPPTPAAGVTPARSVVPIPTATFARPETNAASAAAATVTVAPTVAVPASPTAAATPAPMSGIQINATVGPTCPGPVRPGQVCQQPYAGTFSIQSAQGVEVARVTTNDLGQATLDVPPGQYSITPRNEGRFPRGAPVEVTVSTGQYVIVQIELDTGMR